jgi:hypothetical protein
MQGNEMSVSQVRLLFDGSDGLNGHVWMIASNHQLRGVHFGQLEIPNTVEIFLITDISFQGTPF